MSSRSNGVTKVELSSNTTSCVSRSPSCSRSLIRAIRVVAVLREGLEQVDEQPRDLDGVRRGLRVELEELALLRCEPELGHLSDGACITPPRTAASAPAATLHRRVGEIADFQADSAKEPPRFANEAERECAKVLDFYGVPWEYEPHTFVLEEDEDGRIVEAFTPDFFLPEQNLYLEITVMKQRLVTRKNRKLRKLRERYPDVNVKLFYKRDIERLAQRYRLDLAS